ncbi:MAG: hypothetical protein ABI867_43190 [Kofleriaceae bacterium]
MQRSLAVVLAVAVAACSTPVAIGSLVVGGGGLVASKAMHRSDCDGEGCVYGNALAFLLGVVSLSFVVVGGVSLVTKD